jgi:hypothetical protein
LHHIIYDSKLFFGWLNLGERNRMKKGEKNVTVIREACEASSLGKTTIYSLIAASRLKAVRVRAETQPQHASRAQSIPR